MAQTFEVVLSPAAIAEVEMALALPRIRKDLREPEDALRWLAEIVVLADQAHDTNAVTGVCRDPAWLRPNALPHCKNTALTEDFDR